MLGTRIGIIIQCISITAIGTNDQIGCARINTIIVNNILDSAHQVAAAFQYIAGCPDANALGGEVIHIEGEGVILGIVGAVDELDDAVLDGQTNQLGGIEAGGNGQGQSDHFALVIAFQGDVVGDESLHQVGQHLDHGLVGGVLLDGCAGNTGDCGSDDHISVFAGEGLLVDSNAEGGGAGYALKGVRNHNILVAQSGHIKGQAVAVGLFVKFVPGKLLLGAVAEGCLYHQTGNVQGQSACSGVFHEILGLLGSGNDLDGHQLGILFGLHIAGAVDVSTNLGICHGDGLETFCIGSSGEAGHFGGSALGVHIVDNQLLSVKALGQLDGHGHGSISHLVLQSDLICQVVLIHQAGNCGNLAGNVGGGGSGSGGGDGQLVAGIFDGEGLLGDFGLFLSLVHILQNLSIEHDEGAKALAFVIIEGGVGAAGCTLEADVRQGVAVQLIFADAIEGQNGHIGIALVQPTVVDSLHNGIAGQRSAGSLVGVGGRLRSLHVVQPHAVGSILASLHTVHQLNQLLLHSFQVVAFHGIHDINDGSSIPANSAQPVAAGIGGCGVGSMVEQTQLFVVHVVADPLHALDDQIQLCLVFGVLGVLSPEGQNHVQTVQPQVGAGIGSPGVTEVVAACGQIVGAVCCGGVQICIKLLGDGQIAAVAGHLIGIQQQAGSLIAVSAMGGAVTGALFAGVAGIGTLCPSAIGGDQAGHVLNHIFLVLLLAGDFVEVFNTLEDDAIIVAPVKEIALRVLSLLVIPSEVGLEGLDHFLGIIAGAVYGNVVDVSLGLGQRSSQRFIGSCRKCAHGQQAKYHDQTQHQANYAFHSFHK